MITVNGDPLEWHGGMTVQDVLDARKFTFRMIGVWVNDEPVPKGTSRTLWFLTEPVSKRSTW